MVETCGKQLVEVLKARGPHTPVEMSNALMCTMIDSISDWGFGVHMDAVATVANTDRLPMVDVSPFLLGCLSLKPADL